MTLLAIPVPRHTQDHQGLDLTSRHYNVRTANSLKSRSARLAFLQLWPSQAEHALMRQLLPFPLGSTDNVHL